MGALYLSADKRLSDHVGPKLLIFCIAHFNEVSMPPSSSSSNLLDLDVDAKGFQKACNSGMAR